MTAVDSLYMGKRDSVSAAIYQLPDLETLAAADRWSNNILRNYYLQYPGRLVNNELYLADLKPLENNQIVKRPRKEKIKSFLQPETPVESLTTDNELLVVRPNFWTHKGNGYVQSHNIIFQITGIKVVKVLMRYCLAWCWKLILMTASV